MKALIYILAIVLMALGISVGLMSFFSPGEVVLGVNLGLAATLLTGGVVTLALAGVMTAVSGLRRQLNRLAHAAAGATGDRHDGAETLAPSADRIAKVVAGGAGVAPAAAGEVADDAEEDRESGEAAEAAVTPVAETAEEAEAEEAAQAEAGQAAPAEEAEAEAAVDEAGEDVDVDGLYVIEERIIRNRPARILSDGTVEAETDEGWMRFENLEHLEEYLEAMSHAR